jgi:hypothetical protein
LPESAALVDFVIDEVTRRAEILRSSRNRFEMNVNAT